AKTKRLISAVGTKIEFEIAPSIETQSIESPVERGRIEAPKAEAVGAKRAGEDDLQTVRSIGEIVERLGVCFASVGMIEARDDPPRTDGSNCSGAFRRRIDGFDAKAIRRLPHELFEACAFERGFSGFAPIGPSMARKKACDRAQRRLSL